VAATFQGRVHALIHVITDPFCGDSVPWPLLAREGAPAAALAAASLVPGRAFLPGEPVLLQLQPIWIAASLALIRCGRGAMVPRAWRRSPWPVYPTIKYAMAGPARGSVDGEAVAVVRAA
jgi:hypothetical protein